MSKINTNYLDAVSKNISLPVGAIQLKFSSPLSSKQQISADKKAVMFTAMSPNLIIKPVSLQSSGSLTLPASQPSNINISNDNLLQSTENLGNISNGVGLAKITIAVDCKLNTTNISIISSNKEQTVFKINTSDLLRAVSSVKERLLEPLGLKLQQLIEPTNAACKLFSTHSNFTTPIKKNDKNSHGYEINYYVQEAKEPFSRSRENVGISLLQGGPPTMVSVPSVLDALSGPTTSNMNVAEVLASCDLSTPENSNETKTSKKNSGADEKTNSALVQLGINPETLSPNIGPKGNKRWPCPIASCTKLFPKLSYLKVHILNHKGIRPYKCSYDNCDWSFYTSYKLKRHLETHLNRRDFVCTEQDCNRRFTTIYNLNTHMTLHKRPKSWMCSLSTCDKAFHTRRELEAHMKLHSDVKPPYNCSVEGCSKSYFTPNSLASHMRSHHKEEELCCQWAGCGKKFDKPCRLKTHMRIHTGHRPYVCDFEGCNWRFQCASKLSRHQKKHTNDRKYSCPICKKAFLRSEHLKGHLLTHTGVRNFQCSVANCEAKFTAKSSLYVHLKKHKTQKSDVKFHCPIESCNKVYDSKLNLRQHLLKHHTPILASDSSQLDYITLFGDKEIGEQLLPQTYSSVEVHKSNLSSFIPISVQNNNLETSSGNLGTNKTTSGTNFDAGENNIVVPVLSLTSVQLSNEGQNEGNIVTVPEGFLSFSEGETPSHTNAELGFPDLPVKESFHSKGNSKGLIFQEGSAARTDVLGNIILSQRAKRRQHLNLAKKLAATNDLTKVNFCNEMILPCAVGDTLPISTHLQSSLIQEDGITSNLFDDALISRDIMTDPAIDTQSTINLRDLE
ncbi:Zinc finger X-linked protein ZXDB [Armadillidium nasatum]|uniref:Zinc finger X-linked protein ZXDB n=1 Tax=Armadillidium nasatum TaxID=96803 RepID=A0A5N5SPE0_9CRUS|nr:Zinc finger X-linked protein ZXDB [Armadillidium nasatum]